MRFQPFRKISPRGYGETNFVTGMRGLAVLGVILIHSGGGGLRGLGAASNHLVDFGATGVVAFFVISGFSVAASWEKNPRFIPYLIQRFFRIAPLYYICLWATIAGGLTATYWQEYFSLPSIDFRNIFLHLSFLSWTDYRITNSILGVEWTLSIEFFWYLLIPGILMLLRDKKGRRIVFFSTVALYVFTRLPLGGGGAVQPKL
jgi:peptidoglycan/LPS O-acetylase OafA/YrhL